MKPIVKARVLDVLQIFAAVICIAAMDVVHDRLGGSHQAGDSFSVTGTIIFGLFSLVTAFKDRVPATDSRGFAVMHTEMLVMVAFGIIHLKNAVLRYLAGEHRFSLFLVAWGVACFGLALVIDLRTRWLRGVT